MILIVILAMFLTLIAILSYLYSEEMKEKRKRLPKVGETKRIAVDFETFNRFKIGELIETIEPDYIYVYKVIKKDKERHAVIVKIVNITRRVK